MKIKGKKNLNKVVCSQLAEFGITQAVLSTEYSYIFERAIITYKLTEDEADEIFHDFVAERFGYEIENDFIFSLLHEVGHHMTYDDIGGMIEDFCWKEKNRIDEEMQYAETAEEVIRLENQYFNLPDEIVATQWAVDYIKNHPLETDLMWIHIKIALKEFYKKNGLTD